MKLQHAVCMYVHYATGYILRNGKHNIWFAAVGPGAVADPIIHICIYIYIDIYVHREREREREMSSLFPCLSCYVEIHSIFP